MKYLFAIIIVVALALSACQTAPVQEQNEQEQNEIPPPPVVEEEEVKEEVVEETEEVESDESDTQEIESGLDKFFGPVDDESVITADDVFCDKDESAVTFRFRNLDSKTWQLNQDLPFPPPSGIASVRVTLNGYEVNTKTPLLYQGEPLFRSQGVFSDNCEGVEELAPGEEATCTISPVVLKESTSFTQGVNEIRVLGPGANGIARFQCE